ncbi:MAG: hypothetical protein ACYCSN_03820 [Acidobacteriaceae bacterium]
MLSVADPSMTDILQRNVPTEPDPSLPESDPEPRPGYAPDYQPSPVLPTPGPDMPGLPGLEPAI